MDMSTTQNNDKSTVFQKGGGGTNYEQYIQTAFITTMVVKGNAPCIPQNEIEEIVLQSSNKGWSTDDLFVIAKSAVGTHQLLIQSKHTIVFSADNEIFKDVINSFWKDFNKPFFDKLNDKLIITKNRLNNIEKNYVKGLVNCAKTHNSETDFLSEVNRIKALQERLEIFKTVLRVANDNKHLTDTDVWQFLRCLDVLGYDFLNEGSVDETNFLNLIKLSKHPESTKSEKDIWNSIVTFITKHNPSGGSITKDSIKQLEFYNDFDLSRIEPAYSSVRKLISDGAAILNPIKNVIGESASGYHLSRPSVYTSLSDAIPEADIIFLTGKAGAGKSAIVKDLLIKPGIHSTAIIFKADQFNRPHLANVLADMGISHSLSDLFSCYSLLPEKLIFIDSLEKLLEDSDPDNAFRQLLSFANENDIKVIGTSRKYAVELLIQKYGIPTTNLKVIDVPPLTDEELTEVERSLPALTNPLSNKNIKTLLRSPKYLDFTIRSLQQFPEDFTATSLTGFKNKLWNTLVCNASYRVNGLPAKREDAFMGIAVSRAKEMKLFIKPVNADEEAIDLLESDDVIFQDGTNRKYAPFHDILEDWALVKYVSANYEENTADIKIFFQQLGNQPAIRRAFRLWIEDVLVDDEAKVAALLHSVLQNNQLEHYWADELLVAILKSDDCKSFFVFFEKELLAQQGKFFNRCMHLIKTACKENNYVVSDTPLLLPIGSGWQYSLIFIVNNLTHLSNLRSSILEFLDNWEYRLVFQYPRNKDELNAVKGIVLFFIKQIEDADEFWQERATERLQKLLVTILFDIAGIAKQEIETLVTAALKGVEEKGNWRLRSFYKIVLEKFLGGIRTQRVCLHLPDLVIEAAWKQWKYNPPILKPEDFGNDPIIRYMGDSIDRNHCWGIEDSFTTFPSGIYKTPIYNLLTFHPVKALEFITSFLNYSVEFYVKANCNYKHEVKEIEITLNDGTTVKLWAGWELWIAYRGISVTDYLLECLLMTLEKHLLEIASAKNEKSRESLKIIFEYLYTHSNSVMPLGVMASIMMAYPAEAEEAMLPLVSLKEMYQWESSRPLQEHSSFAPYDDHIPFAQKERWESNQLPHRRKYTRGFADFLVDYQLTIGKINPQLIEIFDRMWEEAKPDDIIWRKKLTEIDTRKWKVSEFEEGSGQFMIQPKYEESVAEFMDTGKEQMEIANKASGYSLKLSKVYEKNEQIGFETWQEYYFYYSSQSAIDILHDRPVTLAYIGLRDFSKVLSADEVSWCIRSLCKTIGTIIGDTRNRNFSLSREYNLIEKEIALSSFHLLFNCVTEQIDIDELTFMMLFALIAPFGEHEIEKITNYIRHDFSKLHLSVTKRIWEGIIHYSKFIKENHYYHDDHDSNRLSEARKKEFDFVESLCKTNNHLPPDFTELNFNQFEAHYLAIAFCIIPAINADDNQYADFIQKFISLVYTDLDKEDDHSYNRNGGRQIHHRLKFHVEKCLAEIILFNNGNTSKGVLGRLSSLVFKIKSNQLYKKNDWLEFVNRTFDLVIYKLEEFISKPENSENTKPLLDDFWDRWNYLYDVTLESKKGYFRNALLLDTDISWPEQQEHSAILENRKDGYKRTVYEFGKTNIKSVIKVLSTIGRKEFLPEGLTWVTDILRKYPKQIENINTLSAERLVKSLYYSHISTIKKNPQLVNDFIWLLDKMIELGNSSAYLFRENVIVYKRNV